MKSHSEGSSGNIAFEVIIPPAPLQQLM
jgi:hypothetical protein